MASSTQAECDRVNHRASQVDPAPMVSYLRTCNTSLSFANRLRGRISILPLALLFIGTLATTAARAQGGSISTPTVLAGHSVQGGVPAWARDREGHLVPPHDEHLTPSTAPPPGLYVSLGDSITYGYGVAQNCHAFPTQPIDIASYCPDGTSYAILVAKALRDASIAGHFMNLGINGATVERVISDELPYLPADTTLVTLYIGTNDSRAVRDPINTVDKIVQKYESHYEQLLKMIHDRAPKARIVLINFPNEKYLAAGYHVPDDVLPRYNEISQILASFIDEHYPNYAVVDTICNPSSYQPDLLYNATVHPNEAGSVILARAITDVIFAGKPPKPPGSCTWYHPDTTAVQSSK